MTSTPLNTRRVLSKLKGEFPQLKIYKNGFLVKDREGHFIEGLLIERTPYKGTFFLWSLLCPVWHLGTEPKLDYSRRLGGHRALDVNLEALIDNISWDIKSDEAAFRRCHGPPISAEQAVYEAGIDKIDWNVVQSLTTLFDCCVSMIILRNPDAIKALRRYEAGAIRLNDRYLPLARKLIRALEQSENGVMNVLAEAERESRVRMNLI